MVRRQCVCGGPLKGLHHTGPEMFGFIPSSSLAHYNYDCGFEVGVTLPGGRVLEQCQNCGAMVLCEYPTRDGSLRGDDPLITYGPGTVYEQCDIDAVPVTYRSFRALMSSGVTGGIMYSGAFRTNLAELFGTTEDRLPSWKVVKDAVRDPMHSTLDEWWYASIGRNFIVLYENSKVLLPVSAWHRIPGTEIKNAHIVRINELNTDPLRVHALDTVEMTISEQALDIPDERRRALALGNAARTRMLDGAIHVGRELRDLPQWASSESFERGAALIRDGHVDSLIETAFGIRHIEVHDGERTEQVDILMRHDVLAKTVCTCADAQAKRICPHIVAAVLEMARYYSFRILIPQDRLPERTHRSADVITVEDQGDSYNHYVDVVAMVREERKAQADYRWLSSFIEPFTMGGEPLYHVEFMDSTVMGLPSVGYCVYSKTVLGFIDIVINRDDEDYLDTMRDYGLDKDVRLDILNVDSMDARLLCALITMAVYRERRNEGFLAECLENGQLVRMLRRLRALDEEASPSGE
ncbi:DNA-binding protein [Bifidobacterium pseudolongum subsp. globosum]|nr:DNA-binding protein [Bifidobacterium sp.]PKU97663.1 DNA-binding protein [Bifidobacterium pseudolongum subsp. globosum]RYQ02532.1 DNA-binding protein [Bifidobacterium pseudolongum subsp. globosum]RYQ18059.1 DNA-binding protein [Bifidobacterium pseudolongum subsp. globosum]RYQ45543.1 DNA-binding protein [Bifidobacterium pseudolongum subsp. globosum]